jgi:hypothetical protein
MLLVTFAGLVSSKEKIGAYGFAGVAKGVSALWLLRLREDV